MKQAARQILLCAAALIAFCLISRLTPLGDYTLYIPSFSLPKNAVSPEEWPLVLETDGIVHADALRKDGGHLSVSVRALRPGDTWFHLKGPDGEAYAMGHLRVGPLRTVFDEVTGGFSGDRAVMIAVTVFFLACGLILLRQFFLSRGPAFYGYGTILSAGFSLFCLASFLVFLSVTVSHLSAPWDYPMMSAYRMINSAPLQFMMLTLPCVVVFSLAMGISNVALLRHETPRLRNVLGLLTSLLLLVGEAIGVYFYTRDFAGSEWEGRLAAVTENVYATFFVYFECMLAGSVLCGVTAARHHPAPDKDFILILGCWFRRDGSLPPLLRGRAERAIAFFEEQKARTGKEAYLIPSGGQGPDESMPEGEAIGNYLLSRGIPRERILPETKARNTYENMLFSRQIIQDTLPGGKTVYATTNYHVFRSGVWAALAGLKAEGIGSRTKWWYWPNAFMRECLGLMKNRWKQELVLLFVLIVFFTLLTMVL